MIIIPPSMKEINALAKPWTGMSFFAGCGGSSVGHKQSGIHMLASNEFVDIARESYELNHPGTLVLGQDIRRLDPLKILDYFDMEPGQLDFMDGSPPCFPEGTMILTSEGFFPIEEIQVGMLVMTHMQRLRRVTELLPKTFEGTMCTLRTGITNIHATHEHPFYVRRGPELDLTGEVEWVNVEDVNKLDYVGVPTRYDAVDSFEGSGTKLKIDNDLLELLGFWIGCGSNAGVNPSTGETGLRFYTDYEYYAKDKELIQKGVASVRNSGFEVDEDYAEFKPAPTYSRGGVKYTYIHGKELADLFLYMRDDCVNSEVNSRVMNLPKEKLKYVMYGLIASTRIYTLEDNPPVLKIDIRTPSDFALRNIALMCARVYGKILTIQKGSEFSFGTLAQGSELDELSHMDADGIIWTPVLEARSFHKRLRVYNFSVEEDESYVAELLIVHNCKGFSTAGVVEKGWGKEVQYSDNKVQQVDDLFDQYCRMLEVMQPKTFVAENVSGLIKGQSKGYFIEVMRQFKQLGYKVRAPMLNSAWLGVPQSRERIIFMGVREDIEFDVPTVLPLPTLAILSEHPKLGHIVAYKHLKRSLIQYLPACNSPMPTITASDNIAYETARFSTAGFIETEDGNRRKLTIEELKCISGIPHDYKLLGTFEQQWERLGRICVPAVAHAASSALVKHVLAPYYKSMKKKPGSRIF